MVRVRALSLYQDDVRVSNRTSIKYGWHKNFGKISAQQDSRETWNASQLHQDILRDEVHQQRDVLRGEGQDLFEQKKKLIIREVPVIIFKEIFF